MGNTQFATILGRGAAGLVLIAGFGVGTGTAMADPPVTMAPPVGRAVSISTYAGDSITQTNTSTDTVYNYTEIPAGERIQIRRAIFDQGGYQLFDNSGQTIVVPFTNQNLYVMKFAPSSDDSFYFVNDNGTPTLYVPLNGSLENATVPGSKWYPFNNSFQPSTPVYLGVAPSYNQFINTGWFPNSALYGGYYGATSYAAGGLFQPSFGLNFVIGGNRFGGWNSYYNHLRYFPAPYHIGFWNRPIYTVINRPRPTRPFQGSFNNYKPGEVRRPSFDGKNPRYNGGTYANRDRNGRPDYNGFNGNNTTGNIYRAPGGTYNFTGNPGGYYSDPRRVPNVILGNGGSAYTRQPFQSNVRPGSVFQQQSPRPGSVFQSQSPRPGSVFQSRPSGGSNIQQNNRNIMGGFNNFSPNFNFRNNRPGGRR